MHDPAVRKRFQATCKIIILEVGYTSDSTLTTSLTRKHLQHVALCRALRLAGWTLSSPVDCPYYVLLLGLTGHIFRPALESLQALGVPRPAAVTLLRKLSNTAVMSAHSLVVQRRQLERALPPSAFVHAHQPP